jgi:hypothetical protein
MRFRRRRDRREPEPSLRPIPNWMLLLAVMAVAVAGGGLTWWLLSIAAADPKTSAFVQIDAIRTGLSAAVGTGGAFALLLAFRRQRSTEVSAVHTITDATERRVTELYTKAADQLGSDKAPVRLAGLYALERLAQDNPSQRQTIVNVVCAYLQMPYTPPGATPVEPGPSSGDGAADDEKRADRDGSGTSSAFRSTRSGHRSSGCGPPRNESSTGTWQRRRPRACAGAPPSTCPGPTSLRPNSSTRT